MLKQCLPSVSTLEVMLNCYPYVPPCDWMESLPPEMYEVRRLQGFINISFYLHSGSAVFCLPPPLLPQEHRIFFNSVRQRSGQPRSLQHLCRCALRLQLGARCHPAVSNLAVPSSVRDYLLLRHDGTLH